MDDPGTAVPAPAPRAGGATPRTTDPFYLHLSDWYWARFLEAVGRPVPSTLLHGPPCQDAATYARREASRQAPAM